MNQPESEIINVKAYDVASSSDLKAALHQKELFTAWNNAQVPKPIGTIKPLE